jgi:two-component system CheB/CheR fusion protein
VINLSELVKQELLRDYAPASVLVNQKHTILYNFGNTVEYFKYPTGIPTADLLSVVREGLHVHLRPALYKAIRENTIVTVPNAQVKRNSSSNYTVKIVIKPVHLKEKTETFLMVSFFESSANELPDFNSTDYPPEDESYVKHLEYELKILKEELQNITEEMENSNEELKSSNEEIMSMNEELQSSNEELETSKEELQSLNEELNTVNNQLMEKIEAVQKTHNDLTNLVNSSSIATIFLDNSIRIKYFTPAIMKIFNFVSADIGRPISDFTTQLVNCSLEKIANRVLDDLIIYEKQVKTNNGTVYKLRCVPYRTEDNRIGGVVITFFNISDIISKEENLKHNI